MTHESVKWLIVPALTLIPLVYASPVNAKIRVGAQAQVRYEADLPSDDPATASDESASGWGQDIRLRRARLKLSAKKGRLKLRAHLAFEKANPRLLSLYLRVRGPWGLRVRLGQSKRLLTRAYLDSSAHLRLVSRSIVGEQVASNRDIGVVVTRRFFSRRLQTKFAIWNGQGANVWQNAIGRFTTEGRVELNLWGALSTEDDRIDDRFGALMGGGIAYGSIQASRQQGANELTRYDQRLSWSGFVALRSHGVELVTEAVWHQRTPVAAQANVDLVSAGVLEIDQFGYSVQLAWQPPRLDKRLELTARWSSWQDDSTDGNEGAERLLAGVGWRLQGDEVKVQLQLERRLQRRSQVADYLRHQLTLQVQGALP
ncbi:MAG TPA: hypothetical protein DCQ06_05525 [Myxococcales bacterium]|nr:hypothetical protein [Myxococcales bacterium]HAN31039.1 hypothetical protein [Myxococcales bacterium]